MPELGTFGGYSDLRQMTTLEERVQRAVSEDVAIMPYDPRWPALFQREAAHLRSCIPAGLIHRIEHFGSTAVPGLAAKPIIDLLVEVRSLQENKTIRPEFNPFPTEGPIKCRQRLGGLLRSF